MDTTPEPTLRERKRTRTRAALVESARQLIEARGYDETTIAAIARAADIGTRTFFAYFDSKEHLLFPETDPRVEAALAAIADRAPSETPVQVLLRGLDNAAVEREAKDAVAQLRLRLLPTTPAVQARALRMQLAAQQTIVEALIQAYPHLATIDASALVGAFTGAVAAAFQALGNEGNADQRLRLVRAAVANQLTGPATLRAVTQSERSHA